MKKIIFFGLFMAFDYFSFGQQYKFEVGLDAGVRLSTLSYYNGLGGFTKPTSYSYLSTGPNFLYNISERMSIKTSIYFTPDRLLSKIYLDPPTRGYNTLHSSSFMIPILARYNIRKNAFRFFIEAGPGININPGIFTTYYYDPNFDPTTNSIPVSSQSSLLTQRIPGLCGGIGVSYQIKNNISFNIEAITFAEFPDVFTPNINNFTHVSFGIGYRFGKKTQTKK